MATLAGAGMVIPVPQVFAQERPRSLPCAPEHAKRVGSETLPDQQVLPGPGTEPLPPVGDASHWSSAPRRGHIMVHHHGWTGTDGSAACHACSVAGITSMWWWEEPPVRQPDGAGTTPWAGEDGIGNRFVVLQRGVDADALSARGVDADDGSVDGSVRGHLATFRATGDPGVGGASLHWREGDERCDHYLLIIQPWDAERELWSLAPTL